MSSVPLAIPRKGSNTVAPELRVATILEMEPRTNNFASKRGLNPSFLSLPMLRTGFSLPSSGHTKIRRFKRLSSGSAITFQPRRLKRFSYSNLMGTIIEEPRVPAPIWIGNARDIDVSNGSLYSGHSYSSAGSSAAPSSPSPTGSLEAARFFGKSRDERLYGTPSPHSGSDLSSSSPQSFLEILYTSQMVAEAKSPADSPSYSVGEHPGYGSDSESTSSSSSEDFGDLVIGNPSYQERPSLRDRSNKVKSIASRPRLGRIHMAPIEETTDSCPPSRRTNTLHRRELEVIGEDD